MNTIRPRLVHVSIVIAKVADAKNVYLSLTVPRTWCTASLVSVGIHNQSGHSEVNV